MTTMKRTVWMLAVLACAVCASQAWATDPVPGNNSGTFIIKITPNVDLGVTVDTTGAAWVGDTDLYVDMDLGATKLLGTGVKLTVAGNFQNQEFQLSGAANSTWALDTTVDDEQDKVRLYAMIGADQNAELAGGAQYAGVGNLITTGASRAGQAQSDESGDLLHTYEFATGAGAEYADVDGLTVSTARRLWLRADTPSQTTVANEQQFTITVTAVSGAGL